MWTFILIIVILLGIKIFCRVIAGLGLVCAFLTDNDHKIEDNTKGLIVWDIIKLVVTIPMFVWGLILLF